MKLKNILITGSNGFIGKNLLEYFYDKSEKFKIFSPKRKELDLLNDKAVLNYIKTYKIEIIIHCASCGASKKKNYGARNADLVSLNLRIFFNLARCLTFKMRMINIGSGAEYDKRNSMHKIKESFFDTHVPVDNYGYAKYVISKYIDKTDNIINLRVFGLYGKYEDYSYKFISNAIVKNLLGLPIIINRNVSFDFLYIRDFLKIVETFLSVKPKHKHYNLTPSKSIDLITIAKLINKISLKKSKVQILNSGMNMEYTGSNSRLKKEFVILKFSSYEKGISKLYKYYSENMSLFDLKVLKRDSFLNRCRIKI